MKGRSVAESKLRENAADCQAAKALTGLSKAILEMSKTQSC